MIKDASLTLRFLCVKYVRKDIIIAHALLIVVIARTKPRVIKLMGPAILAAKQTFGHLFVKIVLTDFIKKTVVQNAENVQTGRLVTKLTELVKMVVV